MFTSTSYTKLKQQLEQVAEVEVEDVEGDTYLMRLHNGHIEDRLKRGGKWSRTTIDVLKLQFLIGGTDTPLFARVG